MIEWVSKKKGEGMKGLQTNIKREKPTRYRRWLTLYQNPLVRLEEVCISYMVILHCDGVSVGEKVVGSIPLVRNIIHLLIFRGYLPTDAILC